MVLANIPNSNGQSPGHYLYNMTDLELVKKLVLEYSLLIPQDYNKSMGGRISYGDGAMQKKQQEVQDWLKQQVEEQSQ